METRIMMLASSMEWFGYCGLGRRGVKLPEAIEWALDCTGIDWPNVGTRNGLARFAAHINNDLKHPDRGNHPAGRELYVAMHLMIMAAQGQLLHKLGVSDSTWAEFRQSPNVQRVRDAFERNDVRVDDRGRMTE